MLAQASLMWLTNTSAGATRFHYTEKSVEPRVNHGPIGVAVFADDFRSIRPFAERDNTDIVSWTEHPRGGHFAAMEVPEELVGGDPRLLPGASRGLTQYVRVPSRSLDWCHETVRDGVAGATPPGT